jgi:hypothetical protein
MSASPSISLPLRASSYGEWLAALGLLKIASIADPEAGLGFTAGGEAFLQTACTENQLRDLLVSSSAPDAVECRYLTPQKQIDLDSVLVGRDAYHLRSTRLNDPRGFAAFSASEDAKPGCPLVLHNLESLEVLHFPGKVIAEHLGIKSPLTLWAGRVEFPSLIKSVASRVSGTSGSFAEILTQKTRTTSRFRFDHEDEQFLDDGGHDSGEGRVSRHCVEWAALIGLSFFPYAAGYKSINPSRHRLLSFYWEKPLPAPVVLIGLQTARFSRSQEFDLVSDGKLKKIRSTGTQVFNN